MNYGSPNRRITKVSSTQVIRSQGLDDSSKKGIRVQGSSRDGRV